jgi:hypothetical protein
METTTPQERIDFLTENYEQVNENCAKALILTEIGFSSSGIATKLGVTDSTAKKYLNRLEDDIGEYVTQALPKPVRYPTYPGDTPKDEVRYSPDTVELSPEFKDRERPINRGCDIEDIPTELISIDA